MVREVSIVGIQMNCNLGDVESNLARMSNWIDRVSQEEPDIICFPELCTSGSNPQLIGARYHELSDTVPGRITAQVGKKSEEYGLYIIFGLIERSCRDGRLFNSAALMSPKGDLAGVYRKNHLLGLEQKLFTPGDGYPIFNTDFGTVGVMICYDSGFPEVARILALRGAEIIFQPSAWSLQDKNTWDINTRSRALENSVFLVGVNRTGAEGMLRLFGDSRVVNPRGDVITSAGDDVETSIFATVDLDSLETYREYYRYLADRRPGTYGEICR